MGGDFGYNKILFLMYFLRSSKKNTTIETANDRIIRHKRKQY